MNKHQELDLSFIEIYFGEKKSHLPSRFLLYSNGALLEFHLA